MQVDVDDVNIRKKCDFDDHGGDDEFGNDDARVDGVDVFIIVELTPTMVTDGMVSRSISATFMAKCQKLTPSWC